MCKPGLKLRFVKNTKTRVIVISCIYHLDWPANGLCAGLEVLNRPVVQP